jgi:hypothetical protein
VKKQPKTKTLKVEYVSGRIETITFPANKMAWVRAELRRLQEAGVVVNVEAAE